MEIKNKVAIITGASYGIGKETAILLTKLGAKVVLAARSKNELELLSKKLTNSFVIPTDMTKDVDIKSMIKKTKEHFGRIDILINNAGVGYDSSVEDVDIKIFQKVFNLDVVAPLIAMQSVIPIMKKQGGGSIINISSGTALMYLPNMSPYSSLKRALAAISLTGKEELKKDKIAISVVYPYITNTNFEKNTIKSKRLKNEPEGSGPFPPDNPIHVAQKIVEAIKSEDAEVFAFDWMKPKS